MSEYGLKVNPGQGMSRVLINCMHQSGLLYVVPAEKSWVCSQEHMPAHSLAGFLKELIDLSDPRVKEMMQRWGIYFRQLPLDDNQTQTSQSPLGEAGNVGIPTSRKADIDGSP